MRTAVSAMMVDLVRSRAHEHGWALATDTGPGYRGRIMTFEKQSSHLVPRLYEVEVRFGHHGWVDFSEKRIDGEWRTRHHPVDGFTWTDVQTETLRLIG
jgi:hypothetical protein